MLLAFRPTWSSSECTHNQDSNSRVFEIKWNKNLTQVGLTWGGGGLWREENFCCCSPDFGEISLAQQESESSRYKLHYKRALGPWAAQLCPGVRVDSTHSEDLTGWHTFGLYIWPLCVPLPIPFVYLLQTNISRQDFFQIKCLLSSLSPLSREENHSVLQGHRSFSTMAHQRWIYQISIFVKESEYCQSK